MNIPHFFYFPTIVCIFAYVSCVGQTPKKTPSVGVEKDSLVPNHNLDNKAWRLSLEKFALREGLARPENQDTSTWFAVLEQFADLRFDSTAQQLKGKAYIQYHRLKNTYTSFSSDGKQMPIDWRPIVLKSTPINSLNLKQEKIQSQGSYKIYRLNQDHNATLKELEAIGIKAPISKIKKAALLGLAYEHALVNPIGFLAHQSEYLYTLVHVSMIDTATLLQGEALLGVHDRTLFDAWLLKIYKPNGDILLSYQTKESIRPGHLLQLSNDERFVLMGTVYDIGDEEGYEPTGPFVLYDISSKHTNVLPAINPDDKQKYPNGVGELAECKFISPFFQLTYYNGPEIGTRFLIDPYKKMLYSRHYPAPTFSEVFTNEGRFRPSISPNGQIKDIDKFSQTSF